MVQYTSRRGSSTPHDITVNGVRVLTVAPPPDPDAPPQGPVVIAEHRHIDVDANGTETVTRASTVAAVPASAPTPRAPGLKPYLDDAPKGPALDLTLMQPDVDRWGPEHPRIRQSITLPRHVQAVFANERRFEICFPASVFAMPLYARMDPKADGSGERPMLAHMVFDLWLGAFVTANGYALNVAPALETVITMPPEFRDDTPRLHLSRYLIIRHPIWKALKAAIPNDATQVQLLLEGTPDDPNMPYELSAWYIDKKGLFHAASGRWHTPGPSDGYIDAQPVLGRSGSGARAPWLPYRLDPVFLKDATSWLSKVDTTVHILPGAPAQAGYVFAVRDFEPWLGDLSTGHEDRKEAPDYTAFSLIMPKLRNDDSSDRYKE